MAELEDNENVSTEDGVAYRRTQDLIDHWAVPGLGHDDMSRLASTCDSLSYELKPFNIREMSYGFTKNVLRTMSKHLRTGLLWQRHDIRSVKDNRDAVTRMVLAIWLLKLDEIWPGPLDEVRIAFTGDGPWPSFKHHKIRNHLAEGMVAVPVYGYSQTLGEALLDVNSFAKASVFATSVATRFQYINSTVSDEYTRTRIGYQNQHHAETADDVHGLHTHAAALADASISIANALDRVDLLRYAIRALLDRYSLSLSSTKLTGFVSYQWNSSLPLSRKIGPVFRTCRYADVDASACLDTKYLWNTRLGPIHAPLCAAQTAAHILHQEDDAGADEYDAVRLCRDRGLRLDLDLNPGHLWQVILYLKGDVDELPFLAVDYEDSLTASSRFMLWSARCLRILFFHFTRWVPVIFEWTRQALPVSVGDFDMILQAMEALEYECNMRDSRQDPGGNPDT